MTKFAVIKKNEYSQKYIGQTQDVKSLCDYIKKYNACDVFERVTKEELLEDVNYKNGLYLLVNTEDNTLELISKYHYTDEGYVYNSIYPRVEVLERYQLVPVEKDVKFSVQELDDQQVCDEQVCDDQVDNQQVDEIYVEIDELNFDDVSSPMNFNNILIIGKRSTGKTTIVNNILEKYQTKYLKKSLVITTQPHFYKCRYPEMEVVDVYNKDVSWEEKIRDCLSNSSVGVLIFDEFFDTNFLKSDLFSHLLFMSKYYEKKLIITMQFPMPMKPEFRENFNYVFMLSDDMYSSQKRLYDYHGKMFPSCDIFRQVFKGCTEDFSSLVCHKSPKGNKAYHYKARLI